jgi:hypothetical protein
MYGFPAAVSALAVGLGAGAAAAATSVEHAGVDCVVAGTFPRFEARCEPPEQASAVRLFFRTAQGLDWYYVPMKASGGSFVGILPKPKSDLKRFSYYIEVVDASFASSRTQERSTTVVEAGASCQGRLGGALSSAASVLVGRAPGLAGAPIVPAGFSPANVVAVGGAAAAGGGLSATTIALIGGGVAAAGAGVAIAAGGGDSGASTQSTAGSGAAPGPAPTPVPTPTPTPTPAASPIVGRWQGVYAWDCKWTAGGGTGSAAIVFDIATASPMTGTASYLGGVSTIRSGSFNTSSSAVRIETDPSCCAVNNEFNGTLSGSTISGTTLNGDSAAVGGTSRGCSAPTGPSGTFTVTRQ